MVRSMYVLFLACFIAFPLLGQDAINQEKLNDLLALCDSTRADEVGIYHKGKLVTHWRRDEACTDRVFNTSSMVKSWTGLVVGILIDRGIFTGVDDPICDYLPDWEAGFTNNITLKDLLTMSAGLYRKGPRGIMSKPNMDAYALQIEPDTVPGIKFSYSNESVHILGMAIEAATGKLAQKVFQEVLFTPLGMDSTQLVTDESGNYVTYGGAQTTVQDAARVGQLVLNGGKWKGKQIVREEWIKNSIQPSTQAPYYGYLWWLDTQSEHPNVAAMGDFGKLTIIFPTLDLVFVRAQTCDLLQDIRMSWMGPPFLRAISDVVEEKP
jgi:CubicO group peptidase (beta-lactamase class C family)